MLDLGMRIIFLVFVLLNGVSQVSKTHLVVTCHHYSSTSALISVTHSHFTTGKSNQVQDGDMSKKVGQIKGKGTKSFTYDLLQGNQNY